MVKMTNVEEMKLWISGTFFMFFLVWFLYWIGTIINPTYYLNPLEWWGLIALLILAKSGLDTYIKDKNE